MSYFRLARDTPYFSAYFIREQRYFMSCVILSMRLEAPFGWFAAAMLYHVEASGLFLWVSLFNMDCGSTRPVVSLPKSIDRKAGNEYTKNEDTLHSDTGELDPGRIEQAASLGRRFDRHFLLGRFCSALHSQWKTRRAFQ